MAALAADDKLCIICHEPLNNGEKLFSCGCQSGHEYHEDCIKEWMKRTNECPLCRESGGDCLKEHWLDLNEDLGDWGDIVDFQLINCSNCGNEQYFYYYGDETWQPAYDHLDWGTNSEGEALCPECFVNYSSSSESSSDSDVDMQGGKRKRKKTRRKRKRRRKKTKRKRKKTKRKRKKTKRKRTRRKRHRKKKSCKI